jgi:hypothetical protein
MEESQEKAEQQQDLLLEMNSAGDTTPLSMPSVGDEDEMDARVASPDGKRAEGGLSVETFELQESSSEGNSPEMEQEKLFIKLKEVAGRYCILMFQHFHCLGCFISSRM